MKHLQLVSLTLLLAFLVACGSGGTTPTPETPPTTPTEPVPPTTPPTEPPTNNTPFYGEWAWEFDGTGDNSYLHEEGRFSIVQTRDVDPAGSGFGFYQICYTGTCYDSLEGGVIFGPGEGNTLTLTLFVVDSAGDFKAVYEATDADGQLTKDDQGRDEFEGSATYYDPFEIYEARNGNFRAVLTDFPVTFPPVE